jgi:hypothetical protein
MLDFLCAFSVWLYVFPHMLARLQLATRAHAQAGFMFTFGIALERVYGDLTQVHIPRPLPEPEIVLEQRTFLGTRVLNGFLAWPIPVHAHVGPEDIVELQRRVAHYRNIVTARGEVTLPDPLVFRPFQPGLAATRFQLSELLHLVADVFPDQELLQWLMSSFATGFGVLITREMLQLTCIGRIGQSAAAPSAAFFRASRAQSKVHLDEAMAREINNEYRLGRVAQVASLSPESVSSREAYASAAAKAVHSLIQQEYAHQIAQGSAEPDIPEQKMFCSPVSVIEKKKLGKPIAGKFRLIHNLSAGGVDSSNAHVLPSEPEVEFQFPTLDQICANILLLGRGALFWKLDLSQAYRNLPLHFMLWPRFAFTYGSGVFVDTRLPFGLRSAPYVFCKFMVIVVWTLAYVLGTESTPTSMAL